MSDWTVGDVALCVSDEWPTRPDGKIYHGAVIHGPKVPGLTVGQTYIVSGLDMTDSDDLTLVLLGNRAPWDKGYVRQHGYLSQLFTKEEPRVTEEGVAKEDEEDGGESLDRRRLVEV